MKQNAKNEQTTDESETEREEKNVCKNEIKLL